jgi:hypothetical protein
MTSTKEVVLDRMVVEGALSSLSRPSPLRDLRHRPFHTGGRLSRKARGPS